jgi:inosine/xanthosine triphosphate pyrophosphatase family protein
MSSSRVKILFATGSAIKLADIRKYLSPYDIVVESVLLDLPEIQAATIEEIAREKCRRAVEKVSMLKSRKLECPLK